MLLIVKVYGCLDAKDSPMNKPRCQPKGQEGLKGGQIHFYSLFLMHFLTWFFLIIIIIK